MKSRFHGAATLSVLAVSALALSACTSTDDGGDAAGGDTSANGGEISLITPGTLTVCSDIPYRPFEFTEGGETVGFDIDLVNNIAEDMGVETEFLRTSVTGGALIMRVFEEAGLPHGVLQLLPGGGDVGAATVEAPHVNVVSFTGSTAAGRHVGAAAAQHLKRAHLELGGNNVVIVLPGADVDLAAGVGAMGSFFHQGQICMTTGRHLVHEDLHDEYVDKLAAKAEALVVGDPSGGPVHLGPIIDERKLKAIDAIVQETAIAGARVVAGGSHEGLFYRPTVLSELTHEMTAWKDEIFGPVAPVMKVSSAEEAVEFANASEYGLSVSIVGDVGEAMKIADRIRSGKIHINEMTVADEANAPFGGMGASGTGSRFGGPTANIDAFTETQWITISPDVPHYPF